MNTSIKCIYCLEEKPVNCYKKTEHVLPQSFGKFKKNLTLNKIVCDTCNKYFGDNLEILLGRDTFEGMTRADHNVIKAEDFKSPGKKSRLAIRVNEGLCKGAFAYREYSEEEGMIIIKPIPQVGFKKIGDTAYEYFPLNGIPEKEHLENNYDLTGAKSIVVLGCAFEVAQKHLTEKGILFHEDGAAYPPERDAGIECEVTGTIDQIVFRAIAKIAFNYFAYWAGSERVLDNAFHPIRRYVRYGEKTTYPFVVIIEKAILGDEPLEGKRRLGHLITFGWSQNRLSLVSQVSLFNWITHSVLIAKDFRDKEFNLRKGSFFDVANNDILELAPGDSIKKRGKGLDIGQK